MAPTAPLLRSLIGLSSVPGGLRKPNPKQHQQEMRTRALLLLEVKEQVQKAKPPHQVLLPQEAYHEVELCRAQFPKRNSLRRPN